MGGIKTGVRERLGRYLAELNGLSFTSSGEMNPLKQYGAAFRDYYQKLPAKKNEMPQSRGSVA